MGWCEEVLLLPPSAGVGAVGMDRRAAAPPGERAPGAGRTAHHRGGRLLHRVRQQHGHHHHLSARPGGAGEGSYTVLGWESNIPPQYRLPRCLSGKEPICQCRRCRRLEFNPCVGKISWRRRKQPIPVFLPGKSHGQRSLEGYSPRGHNESAMTYRLSMKHIHNTCEFGHSTSIPVPLFRETLRKSPCCLKIKAWQLSAWVGFVQRK